MTKAAAKRSLAQSGVFRWAKGDRSGLVGECECNGNERGCACDIELCRMGCQ